MHALDVCIPLKPEAFSTHPALTGLVTLRAAAIAALLLLFQVSAPKRPAKIPAV